MQNFLLKFLRVPDASLTVSVGFDEKYLDYGKILLRSIRQNSPRVKVFVLAINQEESDLREFSEWRNLTVVRENINFSHPYEQRLYTMARRIFLVNELRQNKDVINLLQLDADSIVRRDLNRYGKLFEQGDICILARPNMKHEYLRLTMNVLGLSNTAVSKELTREWVRQLWEILETPQDSKYTDQLTLWKAYCKIKQAHNINLINLSPPYIGVKGNSIIRKFTATKDARSDPKLLRELNKYSSSTPLEEVPSNAPPNPKNAIHPLTRQLLLSHFEKAGFSV